jgi:hypothetical protein
MIFGGSRRRLFITKTIIICLFIDKQDYENSGASAAA